MSHLRIEWDNIDKRKFPEVLKRYRLFRGYTQARLAEKVGVKNTTISNYEKGVSLPDYDTLMKISKTLRVDPGEFYVNWRFCDSEYEDVAPIVVQVERDILTRKPTRWFVALPANYIYENCRAFIVPDEYLREDDDKLNFIVVSPLEEYNEGDAVVLIADDTYPLIGIYHIREDGDIDLKPIKKWNPEYRTGYHLKYCASYEIIGKIISFSYQELASDSDTL